VADDVDAVEQLGHACAVADVEPDGAGRERPSRATCAWAIIASTPTTS
jgi:hypothetical protein